MTLFNQSVSLRSAYLVLVATLLALVMAFAPARAEVPVPELTNYVVDTTNTLTPAQLAELNHNIAQLQAEKGSQIMVLMVPTVQPDDTVETYARRVFDEWRIGRAKIDDGVLVLVAKDDRRMRIETGYGLEGAITDVQASYIINRDMAPSFREGNYFAGIKKAVDQLTLLIQGEDLPAVGTESDSDSEGIPIEFIIFFAIFVLFWPVWLAPFVGGLFAFSVTGSIIVALIGGALAMLWNFFVKSFFGAGKVLEASQQTAKNRSRRRRNDWPGFGGGLGGGGFGGGFGGGGFGGGGGGSSGGGGASGGW